MNIENTPKEIKFDKNKPTFKRLDVSRVQKLSNDKAVFIIQSDTSDTTLNFYNFDIRNTVKNTPLFILQGSKFDCIDCKFINADGTFVFV